MLKICSVDQRWTGAPPSLPSLPRVGREEVPLVSNFRQVGGFLCKFQRSRGRGGGLRPPAGVDSQPGEDHATRASLGRNACSIRDATEGNLPARERPLQRGGCLQESAEKASGVGGRSRRPHQHQRTVDGEPATLSPPQKGLCDKKNPCCFRLFAKVSCGGTLLPLYSRSSKMRACVARKRDGISGIRVGFAWDSKGIRASFWGFAYVWPYKSLGIRRNDCPLL